MTNPPNYRKTVLPSGVTVVTENIPYVRSVSVGTWLDVGSRSEKRNESGIGHFVEHMVFKGTRNRKTHHIAQRMESVGGYLNAFTGKEFTCFYARSLDEHVDRALELTCDLVLNPTFPRNELPKEKDVVLEEMKMYADAPEDLIFDQFETLIYGRHALGRPVIGYPDTVSSFTQEQLLSYVHEEYTPSRMVVAVCGRIDHERAVSVVDKICSSVERPKNRRRKRKPPVYKPGSILQKTHTQQAHVVIGTRTFGIRDERRAPLNLLNTILGAGMSSRLNQNIRERYGFCYNIYSFLNMMSDSGDFGVYMGTDPEKLDKAVSLLSRELKSLARKPVSKRSLTIAKNQLKGALMLGLEDMTTRMMRLGRSELFFKDFGSMDQAIQTIDAVTEDDVLNTAKELLNPDCFSKAIILPENA